LTYECVFANFIDSIGDSGDLESEYITEIG
jgi:hypothetical protein